ncbi:MAG: hypothetical protein ACK5TN_23295, partial [Acidobacteriota bacterium]
MISLPTSSSHPLLDRDQAQEVRRHLAQIVASKEFRTTRRGRQFLEYIVERALEGREELLKERAIGAEVFGRDDTYDPSADSIVRVSANDVRKRLAAFYQSFPASPLSIILPPGSYMPEFRWDPPTKDPSLPPSSKNWSRSRIWFSLAAALLVLLALAMKSAPGDPSPPPTALDRFWLGVIKDPQPVLIGLGHSVAYQPRTRNWNRSQPAPP